MNFLKKTNRILIISILLVSNCLFSFDNGQRIQHIESDVYNGIRDLYLSQSLAMPSTAAPYSDNELNMMLDLLDENKFTKADKRVYNYIIDSLDLDDRHSNKYGKTDWGVDINLESYNHNNTSDFLRRENFIYDFKDQKQLINIGVESWIGDSFYGLGNFSIGTTYSIENTFGSTKQNTNILFLAPNSIISDFDFNFPYRAFIATGGDTWSLEIGRDRVSWGNGVSSNLMIGDNLPYLDELRYTTYSNQFKYTYLLSFFPHPNNYIDNDDDATTGLEQGDPVKGTRALIAHRGEGRLFNNKVNLALSESIMYQTEENVLDLRYLSPSAIFHNYYIRANANSLVTAEMDFTPLKNFNIYAQAAVDEFALPGEPVPGVSSDAYPNAFGYLAGIRYHYDVANKYKGNTSFEFAKTDPYLYLRGHGKDETAQEENEYGINYVVAFREFARGTWYHNEFLGYEYGGDAIVANINSSLTNYGKWNIETNIFYMLHGTFDMFTGWQKIEDGQDTNTYTTPTSDMDDNTTVNSDSREPISDYDLRDAVSRTLVLGASASYDLTKNLNCFIQVDYIDIKNYQNILDQNTSDVQLVLSLSYSI